MRAATQELSGYRFLYRATHVEGFVTKPLHTATQTKTPRARRRRSNQTEHARLPDLHRIHFDPFGKALHPRRCRRAHRGDPRNSRAAVTPHATTIAAATSDPHPPPRSPITPCDCVCEVIARPTRDSLGTCEVCARQRLAQEEHSSASGCQPRGVTLAVVTPVVTRCGRQLTRCGR